MSLSLSDHHGQWTVDDVRKLPEDEFHRYEIDDGVLIVSPSPSSPHQFAAWKITTLLNHVIEAEQLKLVAVPAVDTITGQRGDWLKIPDVIVVTRDAYEAQPQEYDVADVELVVGISGSRQSRKRDFGTKLDDYAEVGIKNYWILELEPHPKLTVFELTDGSYSEVHASDSLLHLIQPFRIEVDPSRLLNASGT
jgi:Uma2 family endonuclease